jgi:hypothetical protein
MNKILISFIRIVYIITLIFLIAGIFISNSLNVAHDGHLNIFSFGNIFFVISISLILVALTQEFRSKKWLLLGTPVMLVILSFIGIVVFR